jgi:hypothetical protein
MKCCRVAACSFAWSWAWSALLLASSLASGGAAHAQGSPFNSVRYELPGIPTVIELGDLDADGDQDVIASLSHGAVATLLGDGRGGLQAASVHGLPNPTYSLAVGDLNGDSYADAVVPSWSPPGSVHVLLGDGQGGFGAATVWPLGSATLDPVRLALADFDADGKLDLLVLGYQGSVAVALGNGTGGFAPPSTSVAALLDATYHPRVEIAHFDGDGKLDVACANGAEFRIAFGDGAGGWLALGPAYSTGGDYLIHDLDASDVNADGLADLVISARHEYWLPNFVFVSRGAAPVLLNGGAGSFTWPTPAIAEATGFARFADVDGDGASDKLIGGAGASISVETGDGFGGFANARRAIGGLNTRSAAVGDLDCDANDDLVLGCENCLYVLRSGPAADFGQLVERWTYSNSNAMKNLRLRAADLDHDNDLDLVSASSEVLVSLNDAGSSFPSPSAYPCGQAATDVALGDVNGDGHVDIVQGQRVFVAQTKHVGVLLGDGLGGFGAPRFSMVAPSGQPERFVLVDMNADGVLDLVARNLGMTGNLSIALGDGQGFFTPSSVVTHPDRAAGLCVGDFDADGKPDLVGVGEWSQDVYLWRGDGLGGLVSPPTVYAGGGWTPVCADFDGDGDLDLALTGSVTGSGLVVFKNDGTGSLVAGVPLASGAFAEDLAPEDVDRDGDIDLVLLSRLDSEIRWYRNDGSGNFALAQRIATASGPTCLGLADLDGDGTNDWFTGSSNSSDSLAVSFRRGPSLPESYCTAKLNSQGCSPAMGWSGEASVTSTCSFTLLAAQVLNQKMGLFFYGLAPAATPFQGGTLCVAPPNRRTALRNSGGNPPPNDCSGVFSIDFNAHIQSGVDPALAYLTVVYAQCWSRDPGGAGAPTSLSNALRFEIGP